MSDPESEGPIVSAVINWLDGTWRSFSKDADWSQAPDFIQIILGAAAILATPPVLNMIASKINRVSIEIHKISSNIKKTQKFYIIIENKSRKILSLKIDILIKKEFGYGNILKIIPDGNKKSNGNSIIEGSCIEIISLNPKSDLTFQCIADKGDVKIYKDKKIFFHRFNYIFLKNRDFLRHTIYIMHERLMLFMLQIILIGLVLSMALLAIGLIK